MFLQGFLLIIQQELSLQVELLLKDELLRCLREEKCSLFFFMTSFIKSHPTCFVERYCSKRQLSSPSSLREGAIF